MRRIQAVGIRRRRSMRVRTIECRETFSRKHSSANPRLATHDFPFHCHPLRIFPAFPICRSARRHSMRHLPRHSFHMSSERDWSQRRSTKHPLSDTNTPLFPLKDLQIHITSLRINHDGTKANYCPPKTQHNRTSTSATMEVISIILLVLLTIFRTSSPPLLHHHKFCRTDRLTPLACEQSRQ